MPELSSKSTWSLASLEQEVRHERLSEEQIIGSLREAVGGIKVKELCRRQGFSEGSFYNWRNK